MFKNSHTTDFCAINLNQNTLLGSTKSLRKERIKRYFTRILLFNSNEQKKYHKINNTLEYLFLHNWVWIYDFAKVKIQPYG